MEKCTNNTTADTLTVLDCPDVFARHLVTSDLIMPREGRGAEYLDGDWHYALDLQNKWKFGEKELSSDRQQFLSTYLQWETVSLLEPQETVGVSFYTKDFEYLPKKSHEQVFLRFWGTTHPFLVFLNDTYLTGNEQTEKPFCIDITDILAAKNIITIAFDNSRGLAKEKEKPLGIALVRTEQAELKSWSLKLPPRYDCFAIAVDIELTSCCAKTMMLSIPELEIEENLCISNGRVHAIIQATPQLWTETKPKLYEVRFAWDNQCLIEQVGFKKEKS
ncbi:hypothetical protein [uncultured Sphaerochaeta sp.]|uniref:hypothetical protein n=1 Tax=uncultured Sphaerochaeta sp. TaxID=886478 RepID=UPI002A0A7C9C|nr:hypothetical protein [uncultured Sphaerochaeta sp.]